MCPKISINAFFAETRSWSGMNWEFLCISGKFWQVLSSDTQNGSNRRKYTLSFFPIFQFFFPTPRKKTKKKNEKENFFSGGFFRLTTRARKRIDIICFNSSLVNWYQRSRQFTPLTFVRSPNVRSNNVRTATWKFCSWQIRSLTEKSLDRLNQLHLSS
jgi:hypothetical protein